MTVHRHALLEASEVERFDTPSRRRLAYGRSWLFQYLRDEARELNSAAHCAVERMIRSQTRGLLVLLGCLAGCVDINGGAVELRWEIGQVDGSKTTCGETQVARVRLCATPEDGGAALCNDWLCSDYQGATAFDIPSGRYALSIAPLCTDGSTPSAAVPAPIVRDISNGDVAQLNTLLIVKVGTDFGDTYICPTL